MKKFMLATALVALTALTGTAEAAVKTYQVTGPVLAVTPDAITVQKGAEKWEIALAGTTIPADVKVGSKVTVIYSMAATSITSKAAATPAKK